jgi:hypothetical protein
MAADLGFKEAVATADTATILSTLQNHGECAGEALLVSLNGELITSTAALTDIRIDPLLSDLIG